ncbi:MAG: glycosyltransferase family 4 protein [Lachnospiraceae bacterium]
MKKVLILANSSSGLYDFRNELVSELLKEYEVYASLPDEVARRELEQEGCRFIFTKINRRGMNPIQDLGLLLTYGRLIRKIRPDCILTYTIKPNLYGGLMAGFLRIPFIPTITGLGTAFLHEGAVNKLVKVLYRASFRRAEVVFFQNERNQKVFVENRLIFGRTKTVPGSGVNLKTHSPESYPGREKPLFLFVGRLMKEKGIEEFLHVAKAYANQAEFVIIGDYEEDYHLQVEEGVREGWLNYEGPQRDVHSFYRKADAAIVASYHEGMSNVVLEAASTARPVLATNIHGCMEAVEDKVTGLLFEAGSREALEKAVESFLNLSISKREAMGQAARRKMEEEFDRNRVAQCYLEEIKNAVNPAE